LARSFTAAPITGVNPRWIRTAGNTNVLQKFHIYNASPTELDIVAVYPAVHNATTPFAQTIYSIATDCSAFQATNTVVRVGTFGGAPIGCKIRLIGGASAGEYVITNSVWAGGPGTTTLTLKPHIPFDSPAFSQEVLVYGGPKGDVWRIVTTSDPDVSIRWGSFQPYRIYRDGVYRVSSTEMQANVAHGLYYMDIPIASTGCGDDKNLDRTARLTVVSGVTTDGYTMQSTNIALTFSTEEETTITFPARFLPVGSVDSVDSTIEIGGNGLQLDYEHNPVILAADTFLRTSSQRVVTSNNLAKHALPQYINLDLYYSGGPTEDDALDVITASLNTMTALERLDASDIINVLTSRGANRVRTPVELTSICHGWDRKIVVERSEDSIGGSSAVSNFEGSARIACVFAGTVNVTKEG